MGSAGAKVQDTVGKVKDKLSINTDTWGDSPQATAAKRVFSTAGDVGSSMYHLDTLDVGQAGKDLKSAAVDSGALPTPPVDNGPAQVSPDVPEAPVNVDAATLALLRQRRLASAYGRQQTILDKPTGAADSMSSLGSSGGSTVLGG